MAEKIITTHPDICNGKAVIRNTRITVQTILEFLATGDSSQDILENYPQLNPQDIEAALKHASKLASHSYKVEAVS